MKREWRGLTCGGEMAKGVRAYLKENQYRFETSGCYDKTHFEIWCNQDETDTINDWIDANY